MFLAPPLLAATLAIVFVAALIRATWGFGDAVVGVPSLTLLIGMQVAAPTLVLVSVALSLLLLRERPSLIDRRAVIRLLLGALIGIPFGLYVLTEVPELWARRGLGVLLAAFAIVSLIRARRSNRGPDPDPDPELASAPAPASAKTRLLDLGFGALAGASNAAFDISGPVLLVHASARKWTPDQLRMNLQAVFLPLALLTMIGHAVSGLWTREVGLLALCCVPSVIVAVVLGARLRAKLDGQRGVVVLYGLILALAVLMFR